MPVVGLHGNVLAACYRGGFCEEMPETSPMSNGAHTSFKTDLLLAKAKLISSSGSPSVIAHLRRGAGWGNKKSVPTEERSESI